MKKICKNDISFLYFQKKTKIFPKKNVSDISDGQFFQKKTKHSLKKKFAIFQRVNFFKKNKTFPNKKKKTFPIFLDGQYFQKTLENCENDVRFSLSIRDLQK